MGLRIIGTGTALPKKSVSNDDLSRFLDTDDEWIAGKTGIKNRFICTDEGLTDLAETAGCAALKSAGIKPGDIDLVICSTIAGDYTTPSLACCVAGRLMANCPAFDINAACSGFIYALDMASAYIDSGRAKTILIISADMVSRILDWTDRGSCVLFGDGAGACVVSGGNALRYIKLTANGDVTRICKKAEIKGNPFAQCSGRDEYLHMDGQEVFRFAVQAVERDVALALDTLGICEGEVDFFLLHQANKRIIDSARARLGQPESKFPINIDRYGNCGSASIPILLHEMLEDGKVKAGNTLLMAAFGAGMATGTCVMQWE